MLILFHFLFSEFVISISGYEGMERLHISRLITLLGGHATDTFSKKNTLLICCKADGLKFSSAQKWRIPVVTVEWLYECVEKKSVLPIDGYLLNANPGDPMRSETSSTPSQVDFSSQVTLEAVFLKNLSKAVKMSCRLPSKGPDEPSSTLQSAQPLNKSESEDCTIPPNGILAGAHIAISQRLIHKRPQLLEVAESLGARCILEIDKSCTHYIHQGTRMIETFKEFKRVRQLGAKIVSPQWLYACRDRRVWLDEASFPHTLVQGLQVPLNIDKRTESARIEHHRNEPVSSMPSSKSPNGQLPGLLASSETHIPDRDSTPGSAIEEFIERAAKDKPPLRPTKFVRRSKSIQIIDKVPGIAAEVAQTRGNLSEPQDTDTVQYETMNFSKSRLFYPDNGLDPSLETVQTLQENTGNPGNIQSHITPKRSDSVTSHRCFLLSAFTDDEKSRYSNSNAPSFCC